MPNDQTQTNASRILDAVIALDRGDDDLAKVVMNELTESGPIILQLCWRATGRVDSTVAELRNRLAGPPNLATMLELHRLMLGEECAHGK